MTVKSERAGRKLNNRGFTLVELLVAMAILSIVVGVALGFLAHAMGAFNRSSRESNLQNEAQLTMTRLQSMVVNASHGVSVVDPRINPDPAAPAALTGADLYVYNREEKDSGVGSYKTGDYLITHIYRNGTKLLYSSIRYTLDASGSSSLSAESAPLVLADFVDGFTVDLTQFTQSRSVGIRVDFRNQDKIYTTENTFFLRNQISNNPIGGADDYFKTDAAADKSNIITALRISPSDVYMWQGSSLASPFSVTAVINGEEHTGAHVVWNITAPAGVNATINRSSGNVRAENDVTGDLTVEATAVNSINAAGNKTDGYVSASATVHVKSFEGVSLSNPAPLSEDDHKIYEAIFSVNGGNLQKETDMGSVPFVDVGSTVSATFEPLKDSSGPSGLRWKVRIRRPAKYKDKDYSLVVGYKLNGQTKTCRLDGIRFTPTTIEENMEIATVRLWDESAGVAYTMDSYSSVSAMRGDKKVLQLQVQYGGTGPWNILDPSDWSLMTDNPGISVTPQGQGYELDLNVRDYTANVAVSLSTSYTDVKTGGEAAGPGLQLAFSPVRIRLSGVTGTYQTKFPVTRGSTQPLSFVIDNLAGAQVCLLDSGDASDRNAMYVAVNGKNASVAVARNLMQTKTFSFGVRTSSGEQLPDTVCVKLSFVPNEANVFGDAGGSASIFLPRAGDLTNYSSEIATPDTEGETAMLYTADGKQAVYRMEGNKYYITYNGVKYIYDTTWRGWIPVTE